MRDGHNIAKKGLPVVCLVTEDFWEQGKFVARSLGMPDLPRVKLPHPVAGLGEAKITVIADSVVETILNSLENE